MLNKRKAKEENDSHRKKCRKYDASYITFGFTSQYRNGEECPQCVICNKLLANESMLPNKLKRHLSSAHSSLVEKPKEYFLRKLENLANQKASTSIFSYTGQDVVMASYKVAYRVARCKKPHTIAEELILLAATDLVSIMVGENAAKKLKDVPLSNNIICRRIEDMGVDISDQLIFRLKDNEFAVQLDEATFGSHDAYLICYVRYLFQAEKRMVEDILFCKPLELRCRGVDMFHVIFEKWFAMAKCCWNLH